MSWPIQQYTGHDVISVLCVPSIVLSLLSIMRTTVDPPGKDFKDVLAMSIEILISRQIWSKLEPILLTRYRHSEDQTVPCYLWHTSWHALSKNLTLPLSAMISDMVSATFSLTHSLWHNVSGMFSLTLSLWYNPSDMFPLTLSLWHNLSDTISLPLFLTQSLWHNLSNTVSLTQSL